jgi:hypothetical protein
MAGNNDIDAPSLSLEQQQCSIDVVWGTHRLGREG